MGRKKKYIEEFPEGGIKAGGNSGFEDGCLRFEATELEAFRATR
jgi:hypothetical protein